VRELHDPEAIGQTLDELLRRPLPGA
jgi:hypothetical protein